MERETKKVKVLWQLAYQGGFIEQMAKDEALGDCRESAKKIFLEAKDVSAEELNEYVRILNQEVLPKAARFTYMDDDDDNDTDDYDCTEYEIIKSFGCEDSEELLYNYIDWYVCYIAKKMIAKETAHFWSDWEMSCDMRDAFKHLTILEERVLYLGKGIGGENPKSYNEIAAMPEFACPKEFIKSVSLSIERTFAKKMRLRELEYLVKKYTKTSAKEV